MRKIFVIVVFFLFGVSSLIAQHDTFWRGVFMFGIDTASGKASFFSTLKDTLGLNIFQVKTYPNSPERTAWFLDNPESLRVITTSSLLDGLVKYPIGDVASGRYDSIIRAEALALAKYRNHLRFYLGDEPEPSALDAWAYVARVIKHAPGLDTNRASSSTAVLQRVDSFLDHSPPEILVETYFLKNNIPHPSLVGKDSVAMSAGIKPWDEKGYGEYFGALQQQINLTLERYVKPTADMARYRVSSRPIPLIFVPQLHGELFRVTGKYDRDRSVDDTLYLRPPSPSEIRLQYNLGLAYGARGFLAFIYGPGGPPPADVEYPGLVSRDPSLLDHARNRDIIFAKLIWTGYNEKWAEFASMNRRLKAVEDTLLALSWVGAKSWSMESSTWHAHTTQTSHWDSTIVTSCSATTRLAYHDELPQVEVGHLIRGSTNYLVVVNRRCANSDSVVISLTLSSRTNWRVTDVENPTHYWAIPGGQSFSDRFEPGGGKIYRVQAMK